MYYKNVLLSIAVKSRGLLRSIYWKVVVSPKYLVASLVGFSAPVLFVFLTRIYDKNTNDLAVESFQLLRIRKPV